MKSIITSFGRDYRIAPLRDDEAGYFYRLPPVQFSPGSAEFQPDPYAFIVSDYVVMDGQSFEKLTQRANPAYKGVADFFLLAREEGILEIRDFESVLQEKKLIHERMIERDLGDVEGWLPIIKESCEIWEKLAVRGKESIASAGHQDSTDRYLKNLSLRSWRILHGHFPTHLERFTNYDLVLLVNGKIKIDGKILDLEEASSEKQNDDAKEKIREYASSYLSYVNANLLLAQEFESAIYDWADFTPYYRDKFLRIAAKTPTSNELSRDLENVFTILFPDISFDDPKRLIKILKDPHMKELRTFCDSAARGKTSFDQNFVNRVMLEIFDINDRESFFGEALSWLGFAAEKLSGLDGLLPKPVESLLSKAVETKIRAPFNWFFMMRDYAKHK